MLDIIQSPTRPVEMTRSELKLVYVALRRYGVLKSTTDLERARIDSIIEKIAGEDSAGARFKAEDKIANS